MPNLIFPLISFLLVACLFAFSVAGNLLPGVLGACLGYWLLSFALAQWPPRWKRHIPYARITVVAALVLVPLLIMIAFGFYIKGSTGNNAVQYKDLVSLLAQTVLDLKHKLPAGVVVHLPQNTEEIQAVIADWIRSQFGAIAHTGQVWVGGVFRAYVGLVIGALIAASERAVLPGPLLIEIYARFSKLFMAFKQIVAAQFWIALFNATLTTVFLFAIMPLFATALPYSYALVALTFFAGLIPIVGNLLCNAVLTLVGVSVSPAVGLACLVFLILIHKTEYFINAKVVGKSTQTSAWELLTAMFLLEALFGAVGLVAAPLFYAYLKIELKAAKWV